MILLLCCALASAIDIEVQRPVSVDQPAQVQLLADGEPIGGLTLQGVLWPEAVDAVALRPGTADSRGRLSWEPRSPGVVRLTTEGSKVLVRVDGPSAATQAWTGLLLLLPLLGLALTIPGLRRSWRAGERTLETP